MGRPRAQPSNALGAYLLILAIPYRIMIVRFHS